MSAADPAPLSPPHIEETVRTISRLDASHDRQAGPFRRTATRITNLVRRPTFILGMTALIGCWIGLNLWGDSFGFAPVDPDPFSRLELAVAVGSLYLVILILVMERHEADLALNREQLILELVISTEQKTAKLIEMFQDFRRDDPLLANRADREADEMTRRADPSSVLDTIKDIRAETTDDEN